MNNKDALIKIKKLVDNSYNVDKLNSIKTWQRGKFIENSRTKHMSYDEKRRADRDEQLSIRSSHTGNRICQTRSKHEADWIAHRLNLLAKIENIISELFE